VQLHDVRHRIGCQQVARVQNGLLIVRHAQQSQNGDFIGIDERNRQICQFAQQHIHGQCLFLGMFEDAIQDLDIHFVNVMLHDQLQSKYLILIVDRARERFL